jgi:hypothetical protein
MSYSQSDILSGVLSVVTLMLLVCWWNKSDGMQSNVPGLKFKSGFVPANVVTPEFKDYNPSLKMRKSRKLPNDNVGYLKAPKILDGFDNSPVASMLDMVSPGNLAVANNVATKTKSTPLLTKTRWNQDMDIMLMPNQLTNEDLFAKRGQFGIELVDDGLPGVSVIGDMPEDTSLAGVILTKTDYEPVYGPAHGIVTY